MSLLAKFVLPAARKIGAFAKRRPIAAFFLFDFAAAGISTPFIWTYIWNNKSVNKSFKLVSENQELQSIIGYPISMGSKRTYTSQGTKYTHKSEQFVYTVVGERGFGEVNAKAETTKYFRNLKIVVSPSDRFNVKHPQISINDTKSFESEVKKEHNTN